jgi:hypothetical protein
MRSGIVAPRPESIASQGDKPRRSGLHAVGQSIVLAQVSDLLATGAPTLAPADLLTAVCQAAAGHLSLTNVVLFKRLAGQSRTLAWSAPGVAAWSRMIAREQAWKRAAALLDDGGSAPKPPLRAVDDGGSAPKPPLRAVDERRLPDRDREDEVAVASVWDERLGLSALLYAESRRRLDHPDQRLLEELLRRMLVLPES